MRIDCLLAELRRLPFVSQRAEVSLADSPCSLLVNRGKFVRLGIRSVSGADFPPGSLVPIPGASAKLFSVIDINENLMMDYEGAEFTCASLEPEQSEVEFRTDEWEEVLATFKHRAVPELPNFHQTVLNDVEIARDHATSILDEFPLDLKFELVEFISSQMTGLLSRDDDSDFLIFDVELPEGDARSIETGGYVQFKKANDVGSLYGESRSRTMLEASGGTADWTYASLVKYLGWHRDDLIANDFGIFEVPTPEQVALLAELTLDTLIVCHGLTSGCRLSSSLVGFQSPYTLTWRSVIPH